MSHFLAANKNFVILYRHDWKFLAVLRLLLQHKCPKKCLVVLLLYLTALQEEILAFTRQIWPSFPIAFKTAQLLHCYPCFSFSSLSSLIAVLIASSSIRNSAQLLRCSNSSLYACFSVSCSWRKLSKGMSDSSSSTMKSLSTRSFARACSKILCAADARSSSICSYKRRNDICEERAECRNHTNLRTWVTRLPWCERNPTPFPTIVQRGPWLPRSQKYRPLAVELRYPEIGSEESR